MNPRDILAFEDFDVIHPPRHQVRKALVDTNYLITAIARLESDGADGAVDPRRRAAADHDPKTLAMSGMRFDCHDFLLWIVSV